jgi:hypothetical protein
MFFSFSSIIIIILSHYASGSYLLAALPQFYAKNLHRPWPDPKAYKQGAKPGTGQSNP